MKFQLIIIVGFFCPLVLLLSQDANSNLFVGVIRDDGILVPVAKYNDTTWISIFGDPSIWHRNKLLGPWYFFNDNTKSPIQLRFGAVVKYNCDNPHHEGYGIVSSYLAHKGFNPVIDEISTIAFTTDTIQPLLFERNQKNISKSEPQVKQFIDSAFRATERKYISSTENKAQINIYLSTLSDVFDSIKIRYRLSSSRSDFEGTHIYNFVVYKEYPKGSDCPMVSKFVGWILKTNNSIRLFNNIFEVDDCDGKGFSPTINPLALFKVGNKAFVMVTVFDYESDGFEVFEFSTNGFKSLVKSERD